MTARKAASRRQVLKVAGVSSAALAAIVAAPRAALAANTPAPAQKNADAPAAKPTQVSEEFLSDLAGKKLGAYTVRSVGSIDRGGVPVVLATASGDDFRVDVLRADPFGRPGIGVASAFAVYLRNGGDGRTATDEQRGIGAMALAKELARRSKKGTKPPAALLTMTERAALDAVS